MPELHPGLITVGPTHPRVRQYLDLKRNRHQEKAGRIALEGMWLVRAAAQRAVALDAALVCVELLRGPMAHELIQELKGQGVPVLAVSPKTFARLAGRDGPDGLLAIAELRESDLEALDVPTVSRVLVLDRLERAGNIGSLIRCADAVAATTVILVDTPVRLAHPVLLKASMGAVFSVPVCRATPEAALAWLDRQRFRLVAADPGGPVSYRDLVYRPRTAVVIGSERLGLSSSWRRAAHHLVALPLRGTADSLNAGHAGAVVLYEVLHRQEAG